MNKEIGELFGFADLAFPLSKSSNVAVILHDLKAEGLIVSIFKGVYYRPKISSLDGKPLPPRDDVVLDYVLKRYNGHAAGAYFYSKINLTQQVGFAVTIATPNPVRPFSFAGYEFVCEKSPIGYVEADKLLVGYLDAMKNIDKIPGCSEARAYQRLLKMVGNLSEADMQKIAGLAKRYPPRVRVILGCAFRDNDKSDFSAEMLASVSASVMFAAKSKQYLYESSRRS